MEIDNQEPTSTTAGWVDVYLVTESGERVFKRRVANTHNEDEIHALHSEMCRALAPSPTTPLPMDRVVLVKYP